MKIKFADKVIQQIGQFKYTSFTTGRSTYTPSIVVKRKIKINRLEEDQEHNLPSIAYLNMFNHLEQEINKTNEKKEKNCRRKNEEHTINSHLPCINSSVN